MFLQRVVKEKKAKVKEWKSKKPLSQIKEQMALTEKRPFYELFSVRGSKEVKIIAEIKKASPSKGELIQEFNLETLVKAYDEGGATALSVITEENYFSGSLQFLSRARDLTKLPLLRKDFIVDEYEIYQSKAYGADAVLLISEALERAQIEEYLELASEINLDVLVEIHSIKSYEKLFGCSGFLLGINNRDLYSLKIDLSVSENLIKNIPENQKVVIESGIRDRKDIEKFLALGVGNFLIGTNLVTSDNPSKMLMELRGVEY
ncbi:MAG: indole-3-glycerol phosphate synthase TrpC [bacterium]